MIIHMEFDDVPLMSRGPWRGALVSNVKAEIRVSAEDWCVETIIADEIGVKINAADLFERLLFGRIAEAIYSDKADAIRERIAEERAAEQAWAPAREELYRREASE